MGFGIVCAVWVGICSVVGVVRRHRSWLVGAAFGVAGYLLWSLYSSLAPKVDITTVRGVLVMTALFLAVGVGMGLALRKPRDSGG